MLTAKPITSTFPDLDRVQQLYIQAFPQQERSPLELLLDDSSQCSQLYAFYDGEEFCGFVSLLTLGDLSHIIYFAVEQGLRERGYGGQILRQLRLLKSEHRIIADLERETPCAPNNDQRSKRRQFYLRSGFSPSGVLYSWRDDEYEILVWGGSLTQEEFIHFWDEVEKINSEFSKF